jgi:hypothetical protein
MVHMRRNGLNGGGDNIFENAREHLRMRCDLLSRQIFDPIIDSNFDGVLPKAVISSLIAGGALHVSPDVYRGHSVGFFVPPLGSYAYDVDGFGNVYGVFYATRMNLQNARLQWDLKDLPSTFNGKSVINIVECTVKAGGMWEDVVLMCPGSSSGGANGVTRPPAPKYFGVNPWTLI